MKYVDSKIGDSLDNKAFEFKYVMETDKYMLKGLASTLGVAMQQPERI